jgi:putative ABC transport system permease protein
MRDLALAFRNLFRHRVRSAIALSAIVFGVAALLQSGGFIDWIFVNLREATIQSRLGHIQVTRPGYFTDGTADPFAFLLAERPPELDRIAAFRSEAFSR